MARFRLAPPWTTHMHYIEQTFGRDPDVTIVSDEDGREVKLYVNGNDKAKAIAQLIRNSVEFGSETLTVTVIPSNDDSIASIVRKAFAGNGAVSEIIDGSGSTNPFDDDRVFVLFKPDVVQFYNDNMLDYYGNENTLYHVMARDVFDVGPMVAFGTESI